MSKKPVILVGTMYSGEGDFDRCVDAVKRQKHPIEHLIIENLPEVEAHLKLYKTFKESSYPFLFKVDADMVLNHPNVVETIYKKMGSLWRVTHYVNDWFTGGSMNGIHMFSQKNDWLFNKFVEKNLRPDRLDLLHVYKKKYRSKHRTIGKVLAKHCHYANARQSFHFGYHSLLKHEHKRLKKFLARYEEHGDDFKLIMAARGILAAREILDYDSYDYNEQFDAIFDANKNRSINYARTNKAVKQGLISVKEKLKERNE